MNMITREKTIANTDPLTNSSEIWESTLLEVLMVNVRLPALSFSEFSYPNVANAVVIALSTISLAVLSESWAGTKSFKYLVVISSVKELSTVLISGNTLTLSASNVIEAFAIAFTTSLLIGASENSTLYVLPPVNSTPPSNPLTNKEQIPPMTINEEIE